MYYKICKFVGEKIGLHMKDAIIQLDSPQLLDIDSTTE